MDNRTDRNIIDFILSSAKNNKRVLKAFLFGSYAKNTNKSDSDIDIALVIDNLDDDEKFDYQVQLLLLASKFDTRIEPHPISNKDLETNNPFVVEILKTGIEISLNTPYIKSD